MRLLIWGAGAIGGTLAAYLVRAGHDVTVVDRAADHIAAINARGLAITGPIANFTVSLPAYAPGDLSGQWDTIVLATKAQDTSAAAEALAPHLTADGYVVSAQNGLNELAISRVVGAARTVGTFVNFGADYLEPGMIHYGGRGAVVVGELDGSQTRRALALREALLDFDDAALVTDNIWGYLWSKEAYGAMLFATALTNESIADALAKPTYQPLYIALARGIRPESFNGFDPTAYLPEALPDAAEQSLADLVAFNRRSAKTHSGIWRDLAVRKRHTEVGVQLGIVVALGSEVGVPAPLTARLVDLIHDIEEGRRPQALATLDLLAQAVGARP